MYTKEEILEALLDEAEIDDFAFQHVVSASRNMIGPDDEDSKAYQIVEALLDLGVLPVTSPYTTPPSQFWPEKGREAIMHRLDHEYRKVSSPLSFLDVCWFRKSR